MYAKHDQLLSKEYTTIDILNHQLNVNTQQTLPNRLIKIQLLMKYDKLY